MELDGGDDGEHNDTGFVEIANIFGTLGTFVYETTVWQPYKYYKTVHTDNPALNNHLPK